MMPTKQPEELQRDYIGRSCTLNGKPAKVCFDPATGFAHISPLNPDLGPVQYSWTAVYNIMDNHEGRFGAKS